MQKLNVDADVYAVSYDEKKMEERSEVLQALEALDSDSRDVVLLSSVSGLNSKEISAITGLTPGSVRSKLSRSLKTKR